MYKPLSSRLVTKLLLHMNISIGSAPLSQKMYPHCAHQNSPKDLCNHTHIGNARCTNNCFSPLPFHWMNAKRDLSYDLNVMNYRANLSLRHCACINPCTWFLWYHNASCGDYEFPCCILRSYKSWILHVEELVFNLEIVILNRFVTILANQQCHNEEDTGSSTCILKSFRTTPST